MPRVLILFAHPALEKSLVHKRLVAALPAHPNLTFHDLYEAYPRLDLDVPHEQALLAAHDQVVLQFPFYWYGTPPILKQWQDLVLEHGWAYGRTGNALHGKTLGCAVSTGGPSSTYGPRSMNRYTVRQFLAPIEHTALLCGMRYLPPWVAYGSHRLSGEDIAHAAEGYRALLEHLLTHGAPAGLTDDADDLNAMVATWPPAEAR